MCLGNHRENQQPHEELHVESLFGAGGWRGLYSLGKSDLFCDLGQEESG